MDGTDRAIALVHHVGRYRFPDTWEASRTAYLIGGSEKPDQDHEAIIITSQAEWDKFVQDNDGDIGIPLAEALKAAQSDDGLWIGGGAAGCFHITYRPEDAEDAEDAEKRARCRQHRDTGRGVCADCGVAL